MCHERGRVLPGSIGSTARQCWVIGLLVVLVSHAGAVGSPTWRQRVEDLGLPLSVVEAETPSGMLIFITGDGGWQRVDQTLAEGIAAGGITTVALSAVRYFLTQKPPAQVATDLRHLVDGVAEAGLPIYLGGYSFGAEVVPDVLANEWTPGDRARIRGLFLLAPSAGASYRVDPLDWVREPTPDPRHLVETAVRRLSPMRIVCVAGLDDAATVCPRLSEVPGVSIVRVPGDHHFETSMPRVVEAATRELFRREP